MKCKSPLTGEISLQIRTTLHMIFYRMNQVVSTLSYLPYKIYTMKGEFYKYDTFIKYKAPNT